jgi:menaquinone-dependent protoporphyrinogen oxidase
VEHQQGEFEMRVLIAYGSKRGGTAGLARMIGDEFARAGFVVDVRPARQVGSVADADVVVIAGALYAFRWHRDVRHFAKRFTDQLRERPVWLVASGPLDDSAVAGELAPVRQVAAVMDRLGARGQVTFGGRLEPDAKGFPARAMAKKSAGDWRDADHVHRWVAAVVGALAGQDRAA